MPRDKTENRPQPRSQKKLARDFFAPSSKRNSHASIRPSLIPLDMVIRPPFPKGGGSQLTRQLLISAQGAGRETGSQRDRHTSLPGPAFMSTSTSQVLRQYLANTNQYVTEYTPVHQSTLRPNHWVCPSRASNTVTVLENTGAVQNAM